MPIITPEQFYAAKTPKPSHMRTADWDQVKLEIRERSFFMAAVAREEILEVFRVPVGKVLRGEISEAEARREIREGLARHSYVPKPGDEGTIKDLSTLKRQDVVIRTNVSIARNHAAYQKQWKARRAFPAKRMVRLSNRRVPRDWNQRWQQAANGIPSANAGEKIALLDSPVWVKLNRFGANYAPYDFNSGMGDIAVKRSEAEAILGSDVVRWWLGEIPLPTPDGTPAPQPSPEPLPSPSPGEPPRPTPDNGPLPAPQIPAPGGGRTLPVTPIPQPTPSPLPSLPAPAPGSPSVEPTVITPAPPGRPAPGMNSTLEVTPAVTTPEGRRALEEALDGLAVFDGDKLVFLDPNGTRPYPAEVLPRIIGGTNYAGVPNKQKEAVREWAAGGAGAILGGVLAGFFAALVWRTLPMAGNETLTLTSVFPTAEKRAAAVEKLPEGGTWQPTTEFPFLATSKAGAPTETDGYALTAQIVRHHTARDLTPSVGALASDVQNHDHNVLIPGGAVFRVESVSQPANDAGPVVITLMEEGGAQ